MAGLFNPSFLFYLGIMVLSIALLVVFFESKFREQNHKISSMFSIVTTLAEDMNQLKYGFTPNLANNGGQIGGEGTLENVNSVFNYGNQSNLIPVSDDEEDDDDDDDSENDDEDGPDSDSDSESDSGSDSDSESDSESEIKVLKIDNIIENDNQELTNLDEKLDENLDLEEQDLDVDDELEHELNEESLELLEESNLEQTDITPHLILEEKSEFKTINIDLEENSNGNGVTDYKKLSLQKLKNIVIEKGLSTDTSKLKKPDLLKLLGVE